MDTKGESSQKKSRSLDIGKAFHCRVLEPAMFELEYDVYHGIRRGKAWEAHRDEHPEKTFLSESEWDSVRDMSVAALMHDSKMTALLRDSLAERSMVFNYRGRPCKIRTDAIAFRFHPKTGVYAVITDLKSARSAKPEFFESDLIRYGYDFAAGFYSIGVKETLGVPCLGFHLFAVENSAPWRCLIKSYGPKALEENRQKVDRLIDLLERCEATGEWPESKPEGL